VLALAESGFTRGVERGSVQKVYTMTHTPLSADTPDQPMHPIPSQPPSVLDLKRAMNQVMFWCAGSRSAHPGLAQLGNQDLERQAGEGYGCSLEVLGDWSAAIQMSAAGHEEDIGMPEGREEYNDLCSAYCLVESLSFADAYIDRRDVRVLEVRCQF
jgi:hypothetical protein